MVNSPLIKAYFLGGWPWGWYLRFPWTNAPWVSYRNVTPKLGRTSSVVEVVSSRLSKTLAWKPPPSLVSKFLDCYREKNTSPDVFSLQNLLDFHLSHKCLPERGHFATLMYLFCAFQVVPLPNSFNKYLIAPKYCPFQTAFPPPASALSTLSSMLQILYATSIIPSS